MQESKDSENPRIRQLVEAVDDIVEHRADDLPLGPPSPLSSELQPHGLRVRSEAETHRLADFERKILNAPGALRFAIRNEKTEEELEPLWTQHVHAWFPSAEAPLVLPVQELSAEEFLDIIAPPAQTLEDNQGEDGYKTGEELLDDYNDLGWA